MNGFMFMDGGPKDEAAKSPLDQLIASAGGAPLPGIFGVGQLLLNTWTERRGGPLWLQRGRATLQTVGILKAYYEEKTGKRKTTSDPIQEEIVKRGLVTPTAMATMDMLAYRKLAAAKARFTDYTVGSGIFREFDCGLVFVFPVASAAQEALSRFWFPGEMRCRPADERRAMAAVADAIWATAKHGLEFVVTGGDDWRRQYEFVPMGPPGAYVDRPENGHAAMLGGIATRCRRFSKAGINRKILFKGEPGGGKSSLARALAVELGNGRVLRFDPQAVGNTRNDIMYRLVDLLQPTVVVLDDMDRADGATALLTHMEQAACNVVGTVNVVEQVDPALLRPGRFDEVIDVGAPDGPWRQKILDFYAKEYGSELPANAAELTDGFMPADLLEVAKVTGIIGADVFEMEVERVRRQRELHSGEAVKRYLEKGHKTTD